jgi:hypothetical protein
MKKVNKNFLVRPDSLLSIRAPYNTAINEVLAAGGWTAAASKLYRAPTVKAALDSIYNQKCAFCENKPVGSPAQVEHYRPKNGVKDLVHTGYYWLAYEWSNLLLACGNCNSTKGTNFPIINTPNRVVTPSLLPSGAINEVNNFINNSPLNLEAPVLINPELDDPNKHLAYLPSGRITHLSTRGDVSIEKYNLNRDELFTNGRLLKRNIIEEKFLKRLERYVNAERNAATVIEDLIDVIIEDIVNPISQNLSFSEFYKQMLLNYEDFFIIGHQPSSLILRRAFLKVIHSI